ncbi:hypothetical protein GGR23_003989 [Gellertiella hungarica]|uniref:Uncharacterized protein n=1 Tax=Gellertiella hungarica TaxID=1572859 RepID=A0A7W6JAC1_9HYPH|nr:hypothetical protein [Gellertiella hungarica]
MRSESPVYDDPFNFMIELLDDNGKAVEALGGANNGIAAKRAFESLVEQYGPGAVICIRQRGRVLRTLAGAMRPDRS